MWNQLPLMCSWQDDGYGKKEEEYSHLRTLGHGEARGAAMSFHKRNPQQARASVTAVSVMNFRSLSSESLSGETTKLFVVEVGN
jgi:hypothetical protein